MLDIPTTIVNLGQVYTESGVLCPNPIVKLVNDINVYVNCIDTNLGIYEIQLPENEELKCLVFQVDCNLVDCANCTSQIIEKCFCDDKGDCPDCNNCIKSPGETSGYCVPNCPSGNCVDNTCVDCSVNTDCPCDQECDGNGNCTCPVGQFVDTEGECCIECNDLFPCGPCYDCIGGKCVLKDCIGGICDPTTEQCEECITKDQCDENESCKDKKCECSEGYVRDVVTGKCVMLPPNPCKNEDDCTGCAECKDYNPNTGYGSCHVQECPENFIAEIVNGECECVYNPCPDTPCTNGNDCGDDCGCNESTGLCEPCSTTDCNNCDSLLGCNCESDICSETDNCDNSCVNYIDCDDNCGCDDGICKDCSNYSCNECGTINGCGCDGNGNCVREDIECEDELIVEKTDCGVTAYLDGSLSCACPVLTFTNKVTNVVEVNPSDDDLLNKYYFNFLIELRKGISNSFNTSLLLPLLKDNSNAIIVDNDLPDTGNIKITTQTFYKEIDVDSGLIIRSSGSIIPLTISIVDRDTVIFTNVEIDKPGYEISDNYFVEYVQVKVIQDSVMNFDNNCIYNSGLLISEFIIDESINFDLLKLGQLSMFNDFKYTTSSVTRKPIMTWKKSDDNLFSNSEIFRKVYVDNIGGKYIDNLYGPSEIPRLDPYPLDSPEGELWSKYNYEVELDCSCAESVVLEDLQICDIEFVQDINFELSNCNTIFNGITSFEPCPINRDLDQYESEDYIIPSDAQTFYKLFIDGILVATYKYNDTVSQLVDINTGIQFNNFQHISQNVIEEVKMTQDDGDCNVTVSLSMSIPDPLFSIDCSAGDTYTLNINEVTNVSGYNVEKVVRNGVEYLPVGNLVTIINLTKGINNTFTVYYTNDCIKEFDVLDDCCGEATISVDLGGATSVLEGQDLNGTINVTGMGSTITYYLDNIELSGNTFIVNSEGTYTAKAIDSLGCEKSTIFILGEIPNDSNFNCTPLFICTGDNAILTITGQPNSAFSYTTPSSVIVNGNLDSSGNYSVAVNESGTFTLTDYNGFANLSATQELMVYPDPSVSAFTVEAGPYCQGNVILFSIVGTPNSIVDVTYSNGTGPAQTSLDGFGQGSISYTLTNSGDHTLTLTGVTIASCTNSISTSQMITVVALPDVTSFSAVCQSANPSSDVDITVEADAGLTMTIDIDGNGAEAFTESPSGTYTLTTSNKGNSVLTASNGTCSIDENYLVAECSCPLIPTPNTSKQIHYFCGATVPTATVTISGGAISAKWYSDVGLTTLVNTGLSYTPAAASALFYVVGEDVSGCQSGTPLIITFSQISISIDSLNYSNGIDPCEGENTVVTANVSINGDGGFPKPSAGTLVYTWNGVTSGGSSGTSGTYLSDTGAVSVEVGTSAATAACDDTENFTIGETICDVCLNFSSSLNVLFSSVCVGEDSDVIVTVTNGTAPYTYEAIKPNGVTVVDSITSSNLVETLTIPSASQSDDGTYTIRVTDSNGCILNKDFDVLLQTYILTIAPYDCDADEAVVTITGTKSSSAGVNITIKANGSTEATHIQTSGTTISTTKSFSLTDGTYNIVYDSLCATGAVIDGTYLVDTFKEDDIFSSAKEVQIFTGVTIRAVGFNGGNTEGMWSTIDSPTPINEFVYKNTSGCTDAEVVEAYFGVGRNLRTAAEVETEINAELLASGLAATVTFNGVLLTLIDPSDEITFFEASSISYDMDGGCINYTNASVDTFELGPCA